MMGRDDSSPRARGTTQKPLARRDVWYYSELLAVWSLAFGLTACSVSPQRPSGPALPGGAPGASDYPKTGPRGGGYYKDDGPGDAPPPNLESTPDPEPKVEPLSTTGNRPYTVFGKSYVPMQEDRPFKQRGMASWYGRKFHGQKTSSGEPYDMYAMTAAHPTLPLPSYAKVTNVKTGKSVIVRVNDRGPFLAGRVMDLSYTAALKLGYVAFGSTEVEVERLTASDIAQWRGAQPVVASSAPAPRTAAAPSEAVTASPVAEASRTEAAPVADPLGALASKVSLPETSAALPAAQAEPRVSEGVFLQLGAFGNAQAAQSLQERLLRQAEGLKQSVTILNLDRWFKVHLGPFENRAEATKVAARLQKALDIEPVLVVR